MAEVKTEVDLESVFDDPETSSTQACADKAEKEDIVITSNFYDEYPVKSSQPTQRKGSRKKKEKYKEFKCSYCGKIFTHKGNMQQHVRTHTQERPFTCNICGMAYKKSSALLEHRRRHKGIHHDIAKVGHTKTFDCNICNRSFMSKNSFTIHLRTHSDELNFSCNHCGKKFKHKSSLSRHSLIHSGIKKFECDLCQKKFYDTSDLRKHMAVHTGYKKYPCSVCGKRFVQTSSLKSHYKVHFSHKNLDNTNGEIYNKKGNGIKSNELIENDYNFDDRSGNSDNESIMSLEEEEILNIVKDLDKEHLKSSRAFNNPNQNSSEIVHIEDSSSEISLEDHLDKNTNDCDTSMRSDIETREASLNCNMEQDISEYDKSLRASTAVSEGSSNSDRESSAEYRNIPACAFNNLKKLITYKVNDIEPGNKPNESFASECCDEDIKVTEDKIMNKKLGGSGEFEKSDTTDLANSAEACMTIKIDPVFITKSCELKEKSVNISNKTEIANSDDLADTTEYINTDVIAKDKAEEKETSYKLYSVSRKKSIGETNRNTYLSTYIVKRPEILENSGVQALKESDVKGSVSANNTFLGINEQNTSHNDSKTKEVMLDIQLDNSEEGTGKYIRDIEKSCRTVDEASGNKDTKVTKRSTANASLVDVSIQTEVQDSDDSLTETETPLPRKNALPKNSKIVTVKDVHLKKEGVDTESEEISNENKVDDQSDSTQIDTSHCSSSTKTSNNMQTTEVSTHPDTGKDQSTCANKQEKNQKKYTCRHCDVLFDDRVIFLDHLRKHLKQTFVCDDCHQTFEKWRNYRLHKCDETICIEKKQKKVLSCKHCNRTFKMKKSLEKHVRKQSKSCGICNEMIYCSTSFRGHLRTHEVGISKKRRSKYDYYSSLETPSSVHQDELHVENNINEPDATRDELNSIQAVSPIHRDSEMTVISDSDDIKDSVPLSAAEDDTERESDLSRCTKATKNVNMSPSLDEVNSFDPRTNKTNQTREPVQQNITSVYEGVRNAKEEGSVKHAEIDETDFNHSEYDEAVMSTESGESNLKKPTSSNQPNSGKLYCSRKLIVSNNLFHMNKLKSVKHSLEIDNKLKSVKHSRKIDNKFKRNNLIGGFKRNEDKSLGKGSKEDSEKTEITGNIDNNAAERTAQLECSTFSNVPEKRSDDFLGKYGNLTEFPVNCSELHGIRVENMKTSEKEKEHLESDDRGNAESYLNQTDNNFHLVCGDKETQRIKRKTSSSESESESISEGNEGYEEEIVLCEDFSSSNDSKMGENGMQQKLKFADRKYKEQVISKKGVSRVKSSITGDQVDINTENKELSRSDYNSHSIASNQINYSKTRKDTEIQKVQEVSSHTSKNIKKFVEVLKKNEGTSAACKKLRKADSGASEQSKSSNTASGTCEKLEKKVIIVEDSDSERSSDSTSEDESEGYEECTAEEVQAMLSGF